jgi:putative RNA 2'-phosphotransferase
MENDLVELSKTLSYMLRHAPWEYELELDEQGWVPLEQVLAILRKNRKEWERLEEKDLQLLIEQSTKRRHEISQGNIRALYGHSTPTKLLKLVAVPPTILYHGTSPQLAYIILKEGLKPMDRQYVHLSVDIQTAKEVSLRKSTCPKILVINANKAYQEGIHFYAGNEHVWLSDHIPPEFIMVEGL